MKNQTPESPSETPLELGGLTPETGPWTGITAWRGEKSVSAPLPAPVAATGTVRMWLKLDQPVVNGPGVETDGGTVIELPGLAKINLWWYRGYGGITWEGAEGQPDLPLEVPGIPGPQWIHLCYTWDAAKGRMEGYINGTPLRLPGSTVEPWLPATPVEQVDVHALRWTVAGLSVINRYISRDEALASVPGIYRGAFDHTLGAQPLGSLDPEEWRGKLLFENPLNTPERIENWKMEGPGEVEFKDGWMRMRSLEPDSEGNTGHIVHWCDQDLPDDFLMEFEVRIINPHGLNIIFFCAKGCNGEDVLDPSLNERTGIFGHYTVGDLNCYHISYYAHTPNSAGGRTTSNLRKNNGFYLVDNGPIGIPPASTGIHHVTLLKKGGTIRLGVDGRRVIDWHDDGVHYGPVLGSGKMSLRQMKWTVAEYRNLRVSQLREGGDQS